MEQDTPQQAEPARAENKTNSRILKSVTVYLRELSVVIVGILITLLITNIISNHTRQKELRGMLSLVADELQDNEELLRFVESSWDHEQHGFRILQGNINNLSSIPQDTLEHYRNIIGNLHYFRFKDDYYQVLKSSVLTQYIKEKELMPRLSATYGELANLADQLERYSDQKSEFFYPMLQGMEPEQTDVWMNGTVYDFFRFPMNDKGFRSFLITGGTIISPGTFHYTYETIAGAIEEIRKAGY